MNQHAIVPPNAISSPQQPQSQQSQGSTSSTGSLPVATSHPTQSKSESLDNIAKVKSLAGPLRDSLAVSYNDAIFLIFLNSIRNLLSFPINIV